MENDPDIYATDEGASFSWFWLAALIGRIVVCIFLVAVIVGAIYATVLPALTYHRTHPDPIAPASGPK